MRTRELNLPLQLLAKYIGATVLAPSVPYSIAVANMNWLTLAAILLGQDLSYKWDERLTAGDG